MSAELIINSNAFETRVALIENGQVAELYIERSSDKGISGNIYKGRVVRVLPGMQAAFVDIGLDKAAFLYVTDVCRPMGEIEQLLIASPVDEGENGAGEPLGGDRDECNDIDLHRDSGLVPIEDRLQEGQEILVQVAKEPIGTKGARITTHITLPGRNLVFMPTMDRVGVSRRIENEEERKRLRDIVCEIKPPDCGFIVRTVAEGAESEKLCSESDFVARLWQSILRRSENAPAPCLIYRELDITLRAVRDLFTKEVDKLVVDSKVEYKKILNFTETFLPALCSEVELYGGEEPIFDAYGIEMEIQRALSKKIWLKSGGYIVIESTEALTAIDVNTGRYVGKRSLEETILKTNLEAVKEIAYQLRLRNIGGIIIIDFIDMEKEANRERVWNGLRAATYKDKSKSNILRLSELGLIEMTRKRTKESIGHILCEPCFYCDGEGHLKSKQTVCYEILRELERQREDSYGRNMIVMTHPEVAAMFYDEERAALERVEERMHATISVKADPNLHLENYDIATLEAE
ncbi:MAG: Rne/Rng family ribonuclease [Syntrophobacteraceae bacterium]|nr:Rne/Rng family ribonuclease [Syntrophobacteraceae bacterium]